jgi:spore coat protein U domain-containing protein, fimbrial subunit CupE1/2/3/6
VYRHRSLVRLTLGLAACVLGAAVDAHAASCSISATPVVFGSYNVFSASPVDTTGSVVYHCNGNVGALTITMTRGQSSTFARHLAKGNENLAYNLYRDAAHTVVWGDFTGGTGGLIDPDPLKRDDVTVTVYGRIPPLQDVSVGPYSDTVTVVVNF